MGSAFSAEGHRFRSGPVSMPPSIRLCRVYLSLLLCIGAAFAFVNAAGYTARRYWIPSRVRWAVIEDFLFSIKAGDPGHAVELLSPETTVVTGEGGETIGLAAGDYFCSFRELARCAIDDEYPKGQMLRNGAFLKVTNRCAVSLVPADTPFPWNGTEYLRRSRREKILAVTAHLREKSADDNIWLFGLNELERLMKARLIPEKTPPLAEKTKLLSAIERQVVHD